MALTLITSHEDKRYGSFMIRPLAHEVLRNRIYFFLWGNIFPKMFYLLIMESLLLLYCRRKGATNSALYFLYSRSCNMKTHTFYKEEHGGWYIDLPEFIEQGGSKGDLAMVAGADTMLDIIANGQKRVTITMDTKPFEGADALKLLRICDPSMGGGDYRMKSFEGRLVHHDLWLCGVTEFVFGQIPECIYVKKV
jgi:hypothetical protein